jgi:heparanase 1
MKCRGEPSHTIYGIRLLGYGELLRWNQLDAADRDHRGSMKSNVWKVLSFGIALALPSLTFAQAKLQPQSMRVTGQVDRRFLSYNVEAVEVTGGRFWKPFKSASEPADPPKQSQPSDPYQYRPPIDLGNASLQILTSALSPAFVRVSGTWRNSTYFQNDDAPALTTVPKGYKNVMTRAEWKGVVDFSHAVGADIVTSVSISDGTRDGSGDWTPNQAKAFFDYTKSIGGTIVATEFMNEPTFASMGAAPAGYDAAKFAKDAKVFAKFLRSNSPKTVFLGPGSVGEGVLLIEGMPLPITISTEDMLKASGPIFDAFSYHFYTTVSERCAGKLGLSWEKALTPAYLDRNPAAEAYYASLRDKYLPGKPIWLTETGEAACGGDRSASTFVDTFRFMDQLGQLAQKNVQTAIVNTLASSDYGLIDETTHLPRPDYWAALLWKQLMSTRVLDPGIVPNDTLRIYAQCMKGVPGGVTLMALNIDQKSEHVLQLPLAGTRYTLSASELLSKTALLNGTPLELTADGSLPTLGGKPVAPGELSLSPETISFLALPDANNPGCR